METQRVSGALGEGPVPRIYTALGSRRNSGFGLRRRPAEPVPSMHSTIVSQSDVSTTVVRLYLLPTARTGLHTPCPHVLQTGSKQ